MSFWQNICSAFAKPQPAAPELPIEKMRAVMASMPAEIWNSTTPPTYFRIRANRAEPVAPGYQGRPGELVFCYRNDDGCISIKKVWPEEAAPA